MRLIIYCSHMVGSGPKEPGIPQKIVAVLNSSAGTFLPVPRVGEYVQIFGCAHEVTMVQYDYLKPTGGIDVWVRIPPDYHGDFKEVKL